MGRNRVDLRIIADSGVEFDDMYYELTNARSHKVDLLRVRRWRALKREIKGDG